ncbi:hypothetical protein [Citricoccus sp.]|uniref:hypothetical protein n=1 Tax=Citricoccus sp. TaxID=1978372 RepID=UPI002C986BFC|nr:hypothetical protein [Citricoccus sp.]HRO93606.1 hypothetical protein [Citricoccus sp.]
MATGVPCTPEPSPRRRPASRGPATVSRGRPSPDRSGSLRRRERSALRRERALIRRRLAAPPPAHLAGSSTQPDDGDPPGAGGTDGGTDGGAGRASGRRRTRLRLAVAALPLAVAGALFVATGPGVDPASVSAVGPAAEDPVAAEDSGMAGSGAQADPLVPVLPPGAGGAMVPSDVAGAAETAAVAEAVPGDVAAAPPVPAAPAGHRPVAVRIADPAALSLVSTGDPVDVIGMDGSVLAQRLEVLQDRSSGSGSGPVLVLAVPDGASAALAAAALSRELTVLLSGESAVQDPGP